MDVANNAFKEFDTVRYGLPEAINLSNCLQELANGQCSLLVLLAPKVNASTIMCRKVATILGRRFAKCNIIDVLMANAIQSGNNNENGLNMGAAIFQH